MTKLNDYTVQLGGPLKKDKAFWWFSVQRYAFEQDPSGPQQARTEVSPRYNGKLTFQLTPNDTLTGSFQYDNYNVTGRFGFDPAVRRRRDSRRSTRTRRRRSGTSSTARCSARPRSSRRSTPGTGATTTSTRSTRRRPATTARRARTRAAPGYYYYADRDRNQVNVSLLDVRRTRTASTTSSSAWRSSAAASRSQFDYMNGVYFYDYGGAVPGVRLRVRHRRARTSASRTTRRTSGGSAG